MNKRRVLEGCKTLLILLLTASALWLVTMTPLVQNSSLADLLSVRRKGGEGESGVVLTSAAHPTRMAVVGLSGRYGVQYDQQSVDELFFRFGSLLGDALVSAEPPEPITETRWRIYLSMQGVCFDFDRDIPLSALGSWLQPEGSCSLSDSARRILLTGGVDDQVILSYQNGADGKFYSCATDLSLSLHLEPAVEQVEGNGAQFAFENEKLAPLIQPYTLVTEEVNGQLYGAENPLSEEENITDLLETLSFADVGHVPVSGGVAYLDGGARLEVGDDGTVSYTDGHERKYPVAAAGETATVAEVIEAARKLAEGAMGDRCGEARLYLESVRETEEGWRVRFGYRLNGSVVWLYEEGWSAQFLIREGCVSEFTLHFRSYALRGEEILLLPMDRAAVILPGLTEEIRELVIQYIDRGSFLVTPGWVAK